VTAAWVAYLKDNQARFLDELFSEADCGTLGGGSIPNGEM